jgi:hypothetical protein
VSRLNAAGSCPVFTPSKDANDHLLVLVKMDLSGLPKKHYLSGLWFDCGLS